MITGNISFTECDQFLIMRADCDMPRNISCHCCTECFGLYTSHKDILKCPSSELKIVFHPTPQVEWVDFYVENNDKQILLENGGKVIRELNILRITSTNNISYTIYLFK